MEEELKVSADELPRFALVLNGLSCLQDVFLIYLLLSIIITLTALEGTQRAKSSTVKCVDLTEQKHTLSTPQGSGRPGGFGIKEREG